MTRHGSLLVSPLVTVLALTLIAVPACAQSGKPALSSEVKRLIDQKGSEAAMGDVMSLVVRLGEFETDEAGMIALAGDYTDAGDPDAALVVLQLQQIAGHGASPELHVARGDAYIAKGVVAQAQAEYLSALRLDPDHDGAATRLLDAGGTLPAGEAVRSASASRTGGEPTREDMQRWQNQGDPREDVARFKGRYASVERSTRVVSVYETCRGSGHLAAAPEWADVASWILRSESELVFLEAHPSPGLEPLRFEFDDAPTASAVSITGAVEGRFERIGDLMDGWEPEGDSCYLPF